MAYYSMVEDKSAWCIRVDPMKVSICPTEGKEVQMEITGDIKMVVDWINGKARQRSSGGGVEKVQKQLREW